MLSRPPKKNDKSYPHASPAWLGLGRPRGDGTGGASGMMRQRHRTRGGGLLGLVGGGDSGRTRRGGGGSTGGEGGGGASPRAEQRPTMGCTAGGITHDLSERNRVTKEKKEEKSLLHPPPITRKWFASVGQINFL
jgi:hypothetical protein